MTNAGEENCNDDGSEVPHFVPDNANRIGDVVEGVVQSVYIQGVKSSQNNHLRKRNWIPGFLPNCRRQKGVDQAAEGRDHLDQVSVVENVF